MDARIIKRFNLEETDYGIRASDDYGIIFYQHPVNGMLFGMCDTEGKPAGFVLCCTEFSMAMIAPHTLLTEDLKLLSQSLNIKF